jgi:serine protease
MRAQLLRDTPRLAKALRRRADVESADLNFIRRPNAVPQDALFPLQWHHPQIRLPEAWDLVAPASGVIVAVVDTGVASAHPELAGQLVQGFDFVSNRSSAADGDGCDPNPEDPGDGTARGTSSWHGTHVAGTVAARTSLAAGAGSAGVAGVAWNARVMPLRALGRAGGSDFDLMQALRYAAGLPNECGSVPQQRADVVNLSLGGPGRSEAFAALIPELRARGLVIVAAAGNDASDAPSFPAGYDGVISVAAVDIRGQRARYSNFGPTIDVAAPGGDLATDVNADAHPDGVLSLMVDDTTAQPSHVFQFAAGTSMASPHVAGVIALMRGVNRALTPDSIDALLRGGRMTRDLGSPALFGAGLIDARAAVEAARDSIAAPPAPEARLAVSPVFVRLGALAREAILTTSNAGSAVAPLRISAVRAATDDGAAWLSVSPIDTDAAGLGRYRASVDRSALAPGAYRGRVIFDSDRNAVEVPVLIDVAAAPAAAPDAGRHWVLLVDAASRQSRRAVEIASARGSYAFRFEGVAAGTYQLLAGSDLDHDGRICEPGESCGAFSSLAQPQALRIAAARAGLDFETVFRARVELAGAGLGAQPVALGAAPR